MLNFLMDEVRVEAINDKHGPRRGVDVVLHSDHVGLDIAHGNFRIKRTLIFVVIPSLVRINADQWEGSAVRPQHHPGKRRGASLG